MRHVLIACSLFALVEWSIPAQADVKLPNIFGSHMVLQQGQKNRVWGRADAGESVTVKLGAGTKQTTAGADGAWQVELDSLPAGGPHSITVQGKNTITLEDVLVGEVWICAGQSNMQWSVNASLDPDLEKAAAKYPQLRLISVPNVGTQETQWNFQGSWQPCTPETVGGFSAVGYFFGRQLQQTLGVPVGLINNAWGGSACEAWIRRDLLAADNRYQPLMARWTQMESDFDRLAAKSERNAEEQKQLDNLKRMMSGNARPGNIYQGVLKPTLGYGIRGAIWYQGESNASRAYQYREMFPLMIRSWREEWSQGDFPFYWVQLADFMAEKTEPADSAWAELREAQTLTMTRLPKTGEAVIIDLGEGKDIHPKNKQDVAKRLARWALADVYEVPGIPCRSPQYQSLEKQGNKLIVSFSHVAGGWRPFDVAEPRGFTIAGEDRKFRNATAKILGPDKIEVWSADVEQPVAVRYAWADNPVCNMFSGAGLPLTPFRSDDWPGVTIDAK